MVTVYGSRDHLAKQSPKVIVEASYKDNEVSICGILMFKLRFSGFMKNFLNCNFWQIQLPI